MSFSPPVSESQRDLAAAFLRSEEWCAGIARINRRYAWCDLRDGWWVRSPVLSSGRDYTRHEDHENGPLRVPLCEYENARLRVRRCVRGGCEQCRRAREEQPIHDAINAARAAVGW